MSTERELLRRIDAMAVPKTPVPWFLDVDGVVNIAQATSWQWPAYRSAHVGNPYGEQFVTWAVGLVAVINHMAARQLVRVRWLTDWEYDAPHQFAPAVGLQVGEWVAAEKHDPEHAPRRSRPGSWWKSYVISQYLELEGGFFIWTDDDIYRHYEARQMTDFLPLSSGTVVCPDAKHGLTPADIAVILTGLESWS